MCKRKFKGTVPWDFWLQVFSRTSFSQAPEYPIMTISTFFLIRRKYSQLKVHHRCRWNRGQIYHWCQWYEWQIATGVIETGGKFDTGGKFAACIAPMVWSFLSTTVQLHATHRKGGRRRKRHSTSTHEWGQQLFRPRLLRVTGRARRVALIKPPPLHPHTPHGQNMWFSGFSAKSEDGLYLEAQKCCSWIRTAFLIMYEFEWKW